MGLQDDMWGWLHPALQALQGTASQPWDERRAQFLEHLGLAHAEDHPLVADLLRQLDELPDEERVALLTSGQLDATAYELVQTHTAEPDAPDASYDDQAWHTFLTTNGPTWDGTAESWPTFRPWFEYHAAEQGLSTPATALLDFLEAQPVPERIAAFASYGVTIAPPPEPNLDNTAGLEDPTKSGEPEALSKETLAELAELTQLINSIPTTDELTAELAGLPDETADQTEQ